MSSVGVAAACRDNEITDRPKEHARRLADRKVMRFLDEVSLRPFVTIMELRRRVTAAADADVAVFTVSGWEGAFERPEVDLQAGESMAEALSRHYFEHGNPTGWLRHMPNNTICQAAITQGFRGPNAHYVGDGTAALHALAVAGRAVAAGDASVAIVCAFDETSEAGTEAAGVALMRRNGQERPWLDVVDPGAAAGTSALHALVACLGALDRCAYGGTAVPVELQGASVCLARPGGPAA